MTENVGQRGDFPPRRPGCGHGLTSNGKITTRGVANRRFHITGTDRGVVAGIAEFTSTQNGVTTVTSVVPRSSRSGAGHVELITAFFRPDGQATSGWPDE